MNQKKISQILHLQTCVVINSAWIVVYQKLQPENCKALCWKFWKLYDFNSESAIEQNVWKYQDFKIIFTTT